MVIPPLHKVSREGGGRERASSVNRLHGYHTKEARSTFSTCARRGVSQGSVCVVKSELLWIPKLSVYKLYRVWSFRIPYWHWYFTYEQDQPSEITWQGFNGILHYDNNKLFFRCRFWRMASCIQITLPHQSVLGLRCVSFKSEVHTSTPQISICSHPSLRLTALEKEALCMRNHNDRWMDWWAGCTSLFPHYRFYTVTLYWCNDWDAWNFKSHRASSGCLWTVIMYVQRSV